MLNQNPKRLLMDFYLNLLAIKEEPWRGQNQSLYSEVLYALASLLETDIEQVQNIFERMANEDS